MRVSGQQRRILVMNSQSCSEHLRHSKFPCNLLLGAESSTSKFLLSASSDLAESTVIDYLGCLSIILLGVNGKESERERARNRVRLPPCAGAGYLSLSLSLVLCQALSLLPRSLALSPTLVCLSRQASMPVVFKSWFDNTVNCRLKGHTLKWWFPPPQKKALNDQFGFSAN